MMHYHEASRAAREAFLEVCHGIRSSVVAEENAALSIGREYLPPVALVVLDKSRDLTADEEKLYYEWLTESVQRQIDERARG